MASSDVPPPQAIHHEIRTAENSAAYLLPALAKLHSVTPKLKLLDVGAGSGSISATLAKAILPDGHVIATDIKADILLRAKAVADTAGVSNIEYQQANVLERLPFEDATFDITHCHQVLVHLPRPADALREMLRVTKPGGIVAAREGDLETECVWPELPGLAKFNSFTASAIRMAGGSPKGGRQLLSWALAAGARRDQVTAGLGTWCFSEAEESRIWVQGMLDAMQHGRLRSVGLQAKLVTEDDLEEMIGAWKEWLKADGAILGMMHGEILIRKDGEP